MNISRENNDSTVIQMNMSSESEEEELGRGGVFDYFPRPESYANKRGCHVSKKKCTQLTSSAIDTDTKIARTQNIGEDLNRLRNAAQNRYRTSPSASRVVEVDERDGTNLRSNNNNNTSGRYNDRDADGEAKNCQAFRYLTRDNIDYLCDRKREDDARDGYDGVDSLTKDGQSDERLAVGNIDTFVRYFDGNDPEYSSDRRSSSYYTNRSTDDDEQKGWTRDVERNCFSYTDPNSNNTRGVVPRDSIGRVHAVSSDGTKETTSLYSDVDSKYDIAAAYRSDSSITAASSSTNEPRRFIHHSADADDRSQHHMSSQLDLTRGGYMFPSAYPFINGGAFFGSYPGYSHPGYISGGGGYETNERVEAVRRQHKKKMKREREEGKFRKSEDHPQYKGNMSVEEVLAFIGNGSPQENTAVKRATDPPSSSSSTLRKARNKKTSANAQPPSDSSSTTENLVAGPTKGGQVVGCREEEEYTMEDGQGRGWGEVEPTKGEGGLEADGTGRVREVVGKLPHGAEAAITPVCIDSSHSVVECPNDVVCNGNNSLSLQSCAMADLADIMDVGLVQSDDADSIVSSQLDYRMSDLTGDWTDPASSGAETMFNAEFTTVQKNKRRIKPTQQYTASGGAQRNSRGSGGGGGYKRGGDSGSEFAQYSSAANSQRFPMYSPVKKRDDDPRLKFGDARQSFKENRGGGFSRPTAYNSTFTNNWAVSPVKLSSRVLPEPEEDWTNELRSQVLTSNKELSCSENNSIISDNKTDFVNNTEIVSDCKLRDVNISQCKESTDVHKAELIVARTIETSGIACAKLDHHTVEQSGKVLDCRKSVSEEVATIAKRERSGSLTGEERKLPVVYSGARSYSKALASNCNKHTPAYSSDEVNFPEFSGVRRGSLECSGSVAGSVGSLVMTTSWATVARGSTESCRGKESSKGKGVGMQRQSVEDHHCKIQTDREELRNLSKSVPISIDSVTETSSDMKLVSCDVSSVGHVMTAKDDDGRVSSGVLPKDNVIEDVRRSLGNCKHLGDIRSDGQLCEGITCDACCQCPNGAAGSKFSSVSKTGYPTADVESGLQPNVSHIESYNCSKDNSVEVSNIVSLDNVTDTSISASVNITPALTTDASSDASDSVTISETKSMSSCECMQSLPGSVNLSNSPDVNCANNVLSSVPSLSPMQQLNITMCLKPSVDRTNHQLLNQTNSSQSRLRDAPPEASQSRSRDVPQQAVVFLDMNRLATCGGSRDMLSTDISGISFGFDCDTSDFYAPQMSQIMPGTITGNNNISNVLNENAYNRHIHVADEICSSSELAERQAAQPICPINCTENFAQNCNTSPTSCDPSSVISDNLIAVQSTTYNVLASNSAGCHVSAASIIDVHTSSSIVSSFKTDSTNSDTTLTDTDSVFQPGSKTKMNITESAAVVKYHTVLETRDVVTTLSSCSDDVPGTLHTDCSSKSSADQGLPIVSTDTATSPIILHDISMTKTTGPESKRATTPGCIVVTPSATTHTHSRPIELMSGTSLSQGIRAPVGVVPPLHFDRSKSIETSSSGGKISPNYKDESSIIIDTTAPPLPPPGFAPLATALHVDSTNAMVPAVDDSTKQSLVIKVVQRRSDMMSPHTQSSSGRSPRGAVNRTGNSAAVGKSGKFDLSAARIFLNKRFQETLAEMTRHPGAVLVYSDNEVSLHRQQPLRFPYPLPHHPSPPLPTLPYHPLPPTSIRSLSS